VRSPSDSSTASMRCTKPVWAPFYTIQDRMAGMLDQYRLTGNKQALEVVQGMANWADNWTATKSEEEHMRLFSGDSSGGMNEVLYNIAAATMTTLGQGRRPVLKKESSTHSRWDAMNSGE